MRTATIVKYRVSGYCKETDIYYVKIFDTKMNLLEYRVTEYEGQKIDDVHRITIASKAKFTREERFKRNRRSINDTK